MTFIKVQERSRAISFSPDSLSMLLGIRFLGFSPRDNRLQCTLTISATIGHI